MPLLQFTHVRKTFGKDEVLKNINLSLNTGEMIGIIGPSGSGKSTLLNIAGCIDSPTSGEVYIEEQKVSSLNKEQKTALRRSHIGFVFQHFQLIESMTVRQNIELPLMLLRQNKQQRQSQSEEMMNALAIHHIAHHKTTAISGGQKQRTAIARALIKRPKLIIADEPTASLDKENANAVFEILKELLSRLNIGLMMASHDHHALAHMQRIVTLDKGEIIASEKQKSPMINS